MEIEGMPFPVLETKTSSLPKEKTNENFSNSEKNKTLAKDISRAIKEGGEELEKFKKKFDQITTSKELKKIIETIKEELADFIAKKRYLRHYSFEGTIDDIDEFDQGKQIAEFLYEIDLINKEDLGAVIAKVEERKEIFRKNPDKI